MDQQARERNERRIRMILPVTKLLFIKRLIVLRASVSQSIMIWMIGLDQNSSRPIAASCASRHLRDQLKRSFRRSEVRQRRARIYRHHAHQSHVREVMSLREHLRTDERIDASGAEVRERLLKHFPTRSRVAIDARDTQVREEQSEHLLELFRA